MKLLSVKILGGNFRSLTADKLYRFNVNERDDRLSAKIFAGLNGSGKSNFLELFSEIFFYLETYQLLENKDAELKAPFGFEIEYILPTNEMHLDLGQFIFEEKDCHVKISKPVNELPEFLFKKYSEEKFIRLDTNTHVLLPKKVIAYTSGQNELLSNPYYKIKYRYFKEYQKIDDDISWDLNYANRLFFLDDTANFTIFICNMLLAENKKLQYLKGVLNIDELISFRITLNFLDINKREIRVRKSLLNEINKLKLCATIWIEKNNQLILDFYVNEATKGAFDFHFTNAFNLFKVFYELDILNLHVVPPKTREMIINAHKSLNISDEIPKVDPSRLIFRIEKIKINKFIDSKNTAEIYYKGLSDGEHQFNEVIGSVLMIEDEGCLFLMDEPDTHFNPKWRAKMIEMLNYVTATSFDDKGKVESVRQQEIVITTHSPFVISDSFTHDVYKFKKIDNTVQYENPKHIETYGASIGLLLQEIFDREVSISDFSNEELEALRRAFSQLKDKNKIKQKIQETKSRLLYFGESVEKFDLYNFLREMEKETAT